MSKLTDELVKETVKILVGILIAVAGFMFAYTFNKFDKRMDIFYDYVITQKIKDSIAVKENNRLHDELKAQHERDVKDLREEINKIIANQNLVTLKQGQPNGNREYQGLRE